MESVDRIKLLAKTKSWSIFRALRRTENATAFGANARAGLGVNIPEPYAKIAAQVVAGLQQHTGPISRPLDVAEAVWRAATDPSCPMRVPVGADAVEWAKAG